MTTAGYYDTSYPPSIFPAPAPGEPAEPATQPAEPAEPAAPADNRMTVAPSAVVSNPVIAAMAPDEQLAAIAHAYAGLPAAEWSVGESASVAGRSVCWSGTEWLAADPEPAA